MGLLDKIFDRDDDEKKARKADFSNVQSGSSSTAPAAQPSAASRPAAPVERERTYTVVAGDTLSKIAQREYGDASQWRRIYEANRDAIKNPDLIYPGQTFRLPPRGDARGGQ